MSPKWMTYTVRMICVALALTPSSLVAQAQRPNIVLLYIDDWAWNGSPVAMHPEMPNSKMPIVQMPNIERLARQGMRFTNAYGSPQCSPARACVLTGQTSARNGFTVFMNPRGNAYYDTSKQYEGFKVVACIANKSVDPATTFGIPKALLPMGYVSAHVGKWHMRSDPGDHGYAVHDGDTNNNPGNTMRAGLGKDDEKPKRLTEANMKDPKLMFSITEKGIQFMEDQVKAGKPFYLQISHYAMHEGRECKVATREKYVNHPYVQAWYKLHGKTAKTVRRKEDPAVWLGMADDLDGRIGAVLDKIDALGIADNTYVIMTADNGYRHAFLPGLTQPLHARKWWVWEGGIRVPMIVKGPGITPGSTFTGNVVNYDFLPTFVEWAGGEPNSLKNIDGLSLAAYLAGREPDNTFLNRNLYFHYPHYRSTMPHTAVISGQHKLMHFWEYPDIPMLFDLSKDIGEVRNIAEQHPDVHQKLFGDMMTYLKEVGGRIPKANPNFDPEKYRAAKNYWDRLDWGPFKGNRQLDDDEREAQLVPDQEPAKTVGDAPQVQFTNLRDGARFPAGTDLRVEVDATDGDGIQEVKFYLNGLLVNPQGKVTAPRVWSSTGDPLLRALKPGIYHLKVVATDKTGKASHRAIKIAVGDASRNTAATSGDKVYQVILNEGESIKTGDTRRFKRLGCHLKLDRHGKLLLRDDNQGKLFQSDSKSSVGPHYAKLKNGQLRIYRGTPDQPGKVMWQSPKPSGKGPYQLGITASKKLVVFCDIEGKKREIVWLSK